MMRSGWIVMVLAACDGGDGKTPDRVDTIVSLTGDPANGAEVYGTMCSTCHGPDGLGLEQYGYPPVAGLAAEEIAATVLDGVPDTLMVAYGDQLTDQEIADIIAHLGAL